MKYTTSVNTEKRTVTVTYDGYKGTARCCPTDTFDLTTGVELALERAKNAKKEAEAKKNATATQMSVAMLAKQLEKVLPKGHIVVAVGGGDACLTEQGKKWLHNIAGGCTCSCHKKGGYKDGYDTGYDDGYKAGYEDAEDDADQYDEEECECMSEDESEALMNAIRKVIKSIGDII
jgi:hypothetical protein